MDRKEFEERGKEVMEKIRTEYQERGDIERKKDAKILR